MELGVNLPHLPPPSKQTPDLWMPWLVASSSLLLYLYVIEEARKGIPFGTQILKP
jgi:hypothetical protein